MRERLIKNLFFNAPDAPGRAKRVELIQRGSKVSNQAKPAKRA